MLDPKAFLAENLPPMDLELPILEGNALVCFRVHLDIDYDLRLFFLQKMIMLKREDHTAIANNMMIYDKEIKNLISGFDFVHYDHLTGEFNKRKDCRICSTGESCSIY
mmetsp:Transcript_39655/g.45150  ORF Transcript_39655/g.45150 Transcript_39655/m.45150 type:complete len:108 (-) Transcript_39655:39-362(-)